MTIMSLCWNPQVQKREVCSDKKKKPSKSKVNLNTKACCQAVMEHVLSLKCMCVCVCPGNMEAGLWGPWFVYVGMKKLLFQIPHTMVGVHCVVETNNVTGVRFTQLWVAFTLSGEKLAMWQYPNPSLFAISFLGYHSKEIPCHHRKFFIFTSCFSLFFFLTNFTLKSNFSLVWSSLCNCVLHIFVLQKSVQTPGMST